MTHDELDIAVLAKLSCGMHLTSMTTQSCKKEQKERKTQRTDFTVSRSVAMCLSHSMPSAKAS